MVQVIKLGYAAFETKDVAAMQAYYIDVMGLTLAEYGDNGAVYLRSAFDYHTIALYPGQENQFASLWITVGWEAITQRGNSTTKRTRHQCRVHAQILSQESPSCCN